MVVCTFTWGVGWVENNTHHLAICFISFHPAACADQGLVAGPETLQLPIPFHRFENLSASLACFTAVHDC